ncbi:MAG: BolA family transcriptional regulator [Aquabacterium sp.]|nr:BolA family transcriptional regulator [Aquabacterium sp.]
MNGVSADLIDTVLRTALAPLQHLEVINESHLHAGHAGAGEGSHFRVKIVSAQLTGLARVARHRLVYDALRDVIPQGVHALAIEARCPAEVATPP